MILYSQIIELAKEEFKDILKIIKKYDKFQK